MSSSETGPESVGKYGEVRAKLDDFNKVARLGNEILEKGALYRDLEGYSRHVDAPEGCSFSILHMDISKGEPKAIPVFHGLVPGDPTKQEPVAHTQEFRGKQIVSTARYTAWLVGERVLPGVAYVRYLPDEQILHIISDNFDPPEGGGGPSGDPEPRTPIPPVGTLGEHADLPT